MSAVHLSNGQIVKESLLTPLAVRVAAHLECAMRYEATNPDAVLAVASGIWLGNAPMALRLQAIRISTRTAGAGIPTVQVYAAGQPLLATPASLTGQTTLLPADQLVAARRNIPAGASLSASILSAPGGYSGWAGLEICLIYLPSIAQPSSWPMLPPFGLWVLERNVDPLTMPGPTSEVFGPEKLVNYDFADSGTGWTATPTWEWIPSPWLPPSAVGPQSVSQTIGSLPAGSYNFAFGGYGGEPQSGKIQVGYTSGGIEHVVLEVNLTENLGDAGARFTHAGGPLSVWIRTTSGAMHYADAAVFYFSVREVTLVTAPGTPLADSWGSGLAWWPGRGTLLTVNNDPPELLEMTPAGGVLRRISLVNFGDVEAVTVINGPAGALAIANEANQIITFVLPYSAAWPASINADTPAHQVAYVIQRIATAVPKLSNLGFEALCYEPATDTFLAANQGPTGSGDWQMWRIANTMPDAGGYHETPLYGLHHALAGLGSDIGDMEITAHGTLVIVGRDTNREQSCISEIRLADGRLLHASTLPQMRQCEGVAFNPDNSALYLIGERGTSGAFGAQFRVYTRP